MRALLLLLLSLPAPVSAAKNKGVQVPAAAPALRPIPALPAPAAGLPAKPAAPAVPAGPAAGAADAGLSVERLAQAAAQPAQPGDSGAFWSQAFDGAGKPAPVPDGFADVSVGEVRSAADVRRLIPSGPNSSHLIGELEAQAGRMAPYKVYRYHDTRGGFVTAIDLSERPSLIEGFPEQHSHEIKLIKKIQLWNKDLRLVVREDGATPDLIMGGVMTELKSLIGTGVTLIKLIDKANGQVRAHARRHGLGAGAAVVDLTAETSVPVDKVLRTLDNWTVNEKDLWLDRIFVFGGSDLKLFRRGADGRYHPETPGSMPAAQLLLKKGRIADAGRALRRVPVPPADQPHHPAAQAALAVEAERALKQVRRLVALGRVEQAVGAWKRFRDARGELASRFEPRAREILPALAPATPKDDLPDPGRVAFELFQPKKLLDDAGIERRVTVYGSARVPEGSRWYEEARKFGRLIAELGAGRIAVVTGGGGGIMEAANRGAFEAGGKSVGFNIKLPFEQAANAFVHVLFEFYYFMTRKTHLAASDALVFFPGGYGTMEELFEVLTLIQTGKKKPVPIVLVGDKEHWKQVLDLDHLAEQKLISPADLSLFRFVDSADEAVLALSATNP